MHIFALTVIAIFIYVVIAGLTSRFECWRTIRNKPESYKLDVVESMGVGILGWIWPVTWFLVYPFGTFVWLLHVVWRKLLGERNYKRFLYYRK